MASEKSIRMQQANALAEVLASLERIEIALGIKPPKREEPKAEAQKAETVKPAPQGQAPAPPLKPGEAATPPRSGVASRQNPARR